MTRRLLLSFLGLAASIPACASASTDLEDWPTATRVIRSGLERELKELTEVAFAAIDPVAAASAPAREALRAMHDAAQSRLAAWRALEDYCGRVLPVLREAPYDGRGVRTVAESWRLLVDALPGVSALSTEQRDETARAMIRANTATAALQAADLAAAQIGEDLSRFHVELSDHVRIAGAAMATLLQEQEVTLITRRDALREIVLGAETELRKEAAGAGVARPGAQAMLDANRPELARLEEDAARAIRARSAMALRFDSTAERVRRAGFAAREWAVAHREAGQAVRRGLPEANFRLLMASAAEFDAPPLTRP